MARTLTGIAASVGLAVAGCIGSVSVAQAADRVTVHEGDFTGNLISCQLLSNILEDEMDYRVKRAALATGPTMWAAVSGGDIDVACENWPSYTPHSATYIVEQGGDGTVTFLGEMGVVGSSGYYVPRYILEGDADRGIEAVAVGLSSHEQLNEYVDVFKTLESGDKGHLLGCPVPAWVCQDQDRIDGLGLNFTATELGSETAHFAEVQAAYKRGEPFIAYAWEPHWVHAEMDLVEIALPTPTADNWPASDWPDDLAFNFGNTEFVEENPDVAALFRNQNLSNADQSKMIYEVEVNGRDLGEVVQEWMDANQDVWRAWIPNS